MSNKIGLIGYNCRTGLGEVNRQIVQFGSVSSWMIRSHPKKGFIKSKFKRGFLYDGDSERRFRTWLKTIDTLLFVETPYCPELVTLAKKLNKRIVCVPMQEWLPIGKAPWVPLVDLFLCPTLQCYTQFKNVLPCSYFPWPIDIARFAFKERETCTRFLFINGNGGFRNRKGSEVIRQVVKAWPEIPLLVRSQIPLDLPPSVLVLPECETNRELYEEGDVLLAPHSIDGLGLEPMEAMATGMPVVSTFGEPWNEFPAIARIPSTKGSKIITRRVDWFFPDPGKLLDICKSLIGHPIKDHSQFARKWAEDRAWTAHRNQFNQLVREGKPTNETFAVNDEISQRPAT